MRTGLSIFIGAVFILGIALFSCDSPKLINTNTQIHSEPTKATQVFEKIPGWQTESTTSTIYVAPNPYPSLLVEIDAVEGFVPTPAHLNHLRNFLQKHCQKPGGIKIVVDDIIPAKTAKMRTASSLALEYIDGPPNNKTALLYIFCYNQKFTKDEKGGSNYTHSTQYTTALFINYASISLFANKDSELWEMIFPHEAGHALGLCVNPSHSDGAHCKNTEGLGCLMSPGYSPSTLFTRGLAFIGMGNSDYQLCSDCLADLKQYAESRPLENVSYLGPYFVRSEKDYHVITLPYFTYFHFGSLSTLDHKHLDNERIRAISRNFDTKGGHHFTTSGHFATSPLEEINLSSLVLELENDPAKFVRKFAHDLKHANPK